MTSLLELRRPFEGAKPWELDAIPHLFEEAGRVQFGAMPGVRWVRDSKAPNGRGFFRGPSEAIEIVAATLEGAGVVKVAGLPPGLMALQAAPPSDIGLPYPQWPRQFGDLRSYQADGVRWLRVQLLREGAALLADEMGLGKTPQAIVALDSILPAEALRLVVCPAVVVEHWAASELPKWAVNPQAWEVISYEKARTHAARTGGGYAAIVPDEIHYISNAPQQAKGGKGSQRSKAMADIAAANPAALRLGLSGTPMTTRPRDLHNPLEWLHPGRWGKAFNFQKRYCNGRFEEIKDARGLRIEREGEPLRPAWVADGVSRSGELHSRLQRVMLRRTKAQVGAELPPLTRLIVEVAIQAAARKGLLAAARACDWAGASLSALRDGLEAAETVKLEAAEALARDALAAGSRVLLLTTRKASAWRLGEALGCPAVTGDDDPRERRGLIADAPCAVATIYSVETGINLTGFDTIIFVGLDWVPARLLQAEARIHRIGQDKPCSIHYLIARGTLDEVIRERVISRLDAFAAITGEQGGVAAGLSGSLSGGDEDDLLKSIVTAAKQACKA